MIKMHPKSSPKILSEKCKAQSSTLQNAPDSGKKLGGQGEARVSARGRREMSGERASKNEITHRILDAWGTVIGEGWVFFLLGAFRDFSVFELCVNPLARKK